MIAVLSRPTDFPVSQPELDDLRRRLEQTRWPKPWPTDPWAAGADPREIRRLADYWRDGFDWRKAEARIAALPSRFLEVEGQRVHYLRFDAVDPSAPWIILTHGWPSSFYELVDLAERLAAPADTERDGGGFTVIVPSLPGFGFSDAAATSPPRLPTHEVWHRLMSSLGATTYFAHGSDLGAAVTSRLAAAHPESVRGVHLVGSGRAPMPDDAVLTASERTYLAELDEWHAREGAYMQLQRTRPETLTFALSDSPVGFLTWIVEKYRTWSDPRTRDLAFDDDFVLTQASLYWFTNSIGTAMRMYYDAAPPHGYVGVPTSFAFFEGDSRPMPPREWLERTHDVRQYTRFEHGGHFPAIEAPEELTRHIRDFAASCAVE